MNEFSARVIHHSIVRVGAVWGGRRKSNASRQLMVMRVYERWRTVYVECSPTGGGGEGNRRRRTTFKLHKFLAAFKIKFSVHEYIT